MNRYVIGCIVGFFLAMLLGSGCVIRKNLKNDTRRISVVDYKQQESIVPVNVITSFEVGKQDRIQINNIIRTVNGAFKPLNVKFQVGTVRNFELPYIEELADNGYGLYYSLSETLDSDTMSLWMIENDSTRLCETNGPVTSCSRTGGWASVDGNTNNIVLGRFDMNNPNIVIHEFGHFYGLEHTFESQKYGETKFDNSNCATTGDRICDTPPDPNVSPIFISYYQCELYYKNDLYKPIINNYMTYNSPCYMKEYSFTDGQYQVMYYTLKLSR